APATSIVNVTLVHGTWARGLPGLKREPSGDSRPKWFEPGSAFYNGLLDALNRAGFQAELKNLDWSGANSILSREWAARELAEMLAQQRTDSPDAARV